MGNIEYASTSQGRHLAPIYYDSITVRGGAWAHAAGC